MTTQIAVRLADEIVTYLDEMVEAGHARSRAAVITRALERDMRRSQAERDARLLRQRGAGDDLDELVGWTAQHFDDEGTARSA